MEWTSVLIAQLWSVPYLIVYGIGLLMAFLRWQRHPQVSLLALCAFGIFLLNMVAQILFQIWLVGASSSGDLTGEQIGHVSAGVTVIRTACSTVAWTLLLFALYGWRTTDRESHGEQRRAVGPDSARNDAI
jgi:hypothetical protein